MRTLGGGLIDYAGLFPPAALSMQGAVEAFARARMGEHEWMLSRFVCPASRLDELSAIGARLMPGTNATSGYREHAEAGEPWRISALVDKVADLDLIERFNERHADEDAGLARVDAIEVKIGRVEEIDPFLDEIPEDLFPFFELPAALPGGDCRGFVAALAGEPCAAKVRTGGVVKDAFPSPAFLGEFLVACRQCEVPFKATAGLHHPVRGEFCLTYEKDSASCTMHGFVNLFVAACFVFCKGARAEDAAAILAETDARAFICTDQGLTWRNHVLDITEIARAREAFALSFGSCSFDEPVEDLKRLGLL